LRPWFERRFSFDHLGPDDVPFLLERLRGLPARVEDKTRALAPRALVRKSGEAWSVQEHIGHLLDLDALHDGRLDDYREGKDVLRGADLKNTRTNQARHNERPLGDLLEALRRERGRLVARLESWDAGGFTVTALHPRLGQPMRLLDMMYFAAEHDDHHLAWISQLARGG